MFFNFILFSASWFQLFRQNSMKNYFVIELASTQLPVFTSKGSGHVLSNILLAAGILAPLNTIYILIRIFLSLKFSGFISKLLTPIRAIGTFITC